MCNNTKGRHNCTCKKGFIGDGENCTGKILPYKPICLVIFKLKLQVVSFVFFYCFSDIDECGTETHNCSDHAMCNNTKGGHNCTCKKGFIGDGVNCTGNTFAFALVML